LIDSRWGAIPLSLPLRLSKKSFWFFSHEIVCNKTTAYKHKTHSKITFLGFFDSLSVRPNSFSGTSTGSLVDISPPFSSQTEEAGAFDLLVWANYSDTSKPVITCLCPMLA
jgi:hypothetical protein